MREKSAGFDLVLNSNEVTAGNAIHVDLSRVASAAVSNLAINDFLVCRKIGV